MRGKYSVTGRLDQNHCLRGTLSFSPLSDQTTGKAWLYESDICTECSPSASLCRGTKHVMRVDEIHFAGATVWLSPNLQADELDAYGRAKISAA
uniref:AlNc14C63G4554 protein n=1 Tax=Albugo laibachii Nc14 TaxID=890382 RepID=F0WD33_9STRA|nr:AlNc14C63G4554 [Albugo laibachii Nc14]|eukprot:CCA19105.1 AlNc14C63G4554 [Albugo laibachii Nc14]